MGVTAKSLTDYHEFIADMARFAENLVSEAAIKKKWHFTDDVWQQLGSDDALVEAIELEKTRRIRTGQTKRERAQQHITRAPDVLAGIMDDPHANARHRVDSVKALDALADNGPQTAPQQDERFVINIVLSANEKIIIDKPLKLGPDDRKVIEHEHDDDTDGLPLLAAMNAASKRGGGGSGNAI